ncbi:hypothetical protein JCM11641_000527 [Rhodosporidiobolus odoratus]
MPPPSATNPAPLHQAHHSRRHEPDSRSAPQRNKFNWPVRQPKYGPRRLAAENHLVAMIGEYIGTVANIPAASVTGSVGPRQSDQISSTPNTSNLLYNLFSFGIALMVCVFIFFRPIGLFNPAVSLGMLLVGAISPLCAILLIVSQLLRGISGAALIEALLPGSLTTRTLKGGGISTAQACWLECFWTGTLMLSILLLAVAPNKAKHMTPLAIGLILSWLAYWTGGSLNPACSFGPAVVVTTFSPYHWIHWVAPALGASIAAGLFRFLKFLEFETVLGSELDSDGCKHPVLQLAPSVGGSADGVPLTNQASQALSEYTVEGTGFSDLLRCEDDADSRNFFFQQLHLPSYEDRFNCPEGMMTQLLESQQQYHPGRTSGDSAWSTSTGRKGGLNEKAHEHV